jgi:hypothetical protein
MRHARRQGGGQPVWSEDDNAFDELDDADTGETLPCPACGQDVYEDSDQCPYCGEWIIPLKGRGDHPTWVRVVGLVVVAALLFGVLAGLVRWIS